LSPLKLKQKLHLVSSFRTLRKEKPQKGKIIAVGEGVKDKPVTVKVGDNVLYGKYSGTEINIDGKEYLIMRNSDIFGII
jgi:chaperonin GroES